MTQSTSAELTTEQPTVAKAVVAGVGALTTGLTTALADGAVTIWEVVFAVLLTIGSVAAVWATTNKRS